LIHELFFIAITIYMMKNHSLWQEIISLVKLKDEVILEFNENGLKFLKTVEIYLIISGVSFLTQIGITFFFSKLKKTFLTHPQKGKISLFTFNL
jgi:hypothetical protein